jgi:hypothetical protein
MSFSNSSPPRSRTLGRGGSLVMVEKGARAAGKAQPLRPRRWQAYASRRQDWTNSATWPFLLRLAGPGNGKEVKGFDDPKRESRPGGIFHVLCVGLWANSCCGKKAPSQR